MPPSWTTHESQPCLWMAAGLITYRLCDRDFDCEHCPLDAALQGDSRRPGSTAKHHGGRPAASHFPADRQYSSGHVWVRPEDDGTARLGLDAFAANLLDRLIEARCGLAASQPGEVFSELRLDSGALSLALPIRARTTHGNPLLRDQPHLALTAPYGDGWLVTTAGTDSADFELLMSADEALQRSQQDLRLFRRRIALEMLTDAGDLGRCMADGGEPLTDLRQMLGAPRYCALLRELVH